ncbi:hypothetical protein [Streptomyces zaomyceticus]|uniref:hypothetical protein n=1 Tax=Streptomyces zaomyceticus TaxID=68286 RepID=UPI00167424A8|nr:hypothetical protein [Streptomyces zaomyceticus]
MKARAEKLQRRSFPLISWFFTLVLVALTVKIGAGMNGRSDRDAFGVMTVCLVAVAVVRRFMGSRIYLVDPDVLIVNPLVTHVVPLRALRSVESDGGLTLVTVDGGEIGSIAFGGSLVDSFVGTADRAADRIRARMRRPSRQGGAPSVVRRYTTAWIADACALGAVACAAMAVAAG